MHLKRSDRRAKLFLWMSICCVALLLTEMGLAQSQLPNLKGDNTAHSDRQKAAQSGAHGDIVLAIDDKEMSSLPQLASSLYLHPTDELMKVKVLRGTDKLTFHVPVFAQKHDVDRLVDLVDPEKNLVRKIGVLAVDLDDRVLGILPDLRIKSGVVVVANSAYSRAVDARLRPGDVIHSVNTKPITNLEELRRELTAFHAGDAVVLQVERSDGMDYVAFEID